MMSREPLDLRRLPVWERIELVLQRSDALSTGNSFAFLTEVDPRALMGRLDQLRPGHLWFEYRNVGHSDWHVLLTRVKAHDGPASTALALQRSAPFARLTDDARSHLARSLVEHGGRKGEVVCPENVHCERLGILLEGALGAFVGAGSRERLLFYRYPFEVFGDIEFFDRARSVGRRVILSKTARYATVSYDTIEEIGMRDPAFLISLATGVSQHARTLASALAAQVAQPILSRVAQALLPYAAPERGLQPALPPLAMMTQTQLAAGAGTVKEVAARAIAELERAQALRRERGHIRYLDRSKLLRVIQAP